MSGLLHNGTDGTPTFRKKEAVFTDGNWLTIQLEHGNSMVCMYTSAGQPMAINLVPMSALPIPNDHTM
jgi:hypothetical protein